MKKTNLLIILLASLLCHACVKPIEEQTIETVDYKKPINLHLPQKAYLHLDNAKSQIRGNQALSNPAQFGITGLIISSALAKSTNDEKSLLKKTPFNEASQIEFLRSLKEVLEKNRVFKTVEIVSEKSKSLDSQAVKINLTFTKIYLREFTGELIVRAEMQIERSGKTLFKHKYLIESQAGDFFNTPSAKEKLNAVADQLMIKIIASIKTWHKEI